MTGRKTVRALAALAVVAMVFAVSGCAMKGFYMDSAGTTLRQAKKLSLEQQYELKNVRYEQMQAHYAEAQRQISTEPWIRISYGIVANPGSTALLTVAGATADNSYYMQISSSILMPGGLGDPADLDPMVEHFKSRGWPNEVHQRGLDGGWWVVRALTDEGYLFDYRVQKSGYYNLSLYSGTYWGDRKGLQRALHGRLPPNWKGARDSVPGNYISPPSWSDPVLRNR